MIGVRIQGLEDIITMVVQMGIENTINLMAMADREIHLTIMDLVGIGDFLDGATIGTKSNTTKVLYTTFA